MQSDSLRGPQLGPANGARGLGSVLRGAVARLVVLVLVALVSAYRVGLRPLLVGSCKFCPTCSEYFLEAVQRHGPVRGVWLGLRRLLRCHPFGVGGYDPVP